MDGGGNRWREAGLSARLIRQSSPLCHRGRLSERDEQAGTTDMLFYTTVEGGAIEALPAEEAGWP